MRRLRGSSGDARDGDIRPGRTTGLRSDREDEGGGRRAVHLQARADDHRLGSSAIDFEMLRTFGSAATLTVTVTGTAGPRGSAPPTVERAGGNRCGLRFR